MALNMREHYGWQFPDLETHLPRMLKKSVDKGLPAEYQIAVRQRSIELCKKRDVALDVGANIGNHSAYLAKFCKKVLAIEPNPESFRLLEINVPNNVVCKK
jgi:predicted RNA methylase